MTAALKVEQAPEAAHEEAPDADTLALAALQAHYKDRRVLNLIRHERRDYTGPATEKVRVGGALVVEYWAKDGDVFTHEKHEIDDANRPFDEATITALGAGAPLLIRDIVA